MTAESHDLQREEELLKKALLREDPSAGFAGQVLAQAAQADSGKNSVRNFGWYAFLFRPIVRWSAATAVSASLIVGVLHYRREQRERAEGEAAKQQLMLALHIAGNKLHLARAKVNEVNADRPQATPATSRSGSRL